MAVRHKQLGQKLKQERERLLKELEQLRTESTTSGDMREGSPFGKKEVGATEAYEMEKRFALEKPLKDLLDQIEHALLKFEAGTYGICDSCGNPIGPERLEVLPQANLCLNCKENSAKDPKSGAVLR